LTLNLEGNLRMEEPQRPRPKGKGGWFHRIDLARQVDEEKAKKVTSNQNDVEAPGKRSPPT